MWIVTIEINGKKDFDECLNKKEIDSIIKKWLEKASRSYPNNSFIPRIFKVHGMVKREP